MNYRPIANLHSPHLSTSLLRHARHGMLVFFTCLLLTACGGGEEAAPAAEAPVSALPTTEATVSAAAAPTDTTAPATAAATPEGIATLATAPIAAGAVTTTTAPTDSMTASTTLAAETEDCAIESSLDLVGYPHLEQRMGCATEPPVFDPIAINEFGDADKPTDRFMLWFGTEKTIYVLLPDGTYQTHLDTWDEATEPTYPCNPLGGVEDSPPLPRRGFGKLWCSSPELQAILGTVPREERLCQYAVLQRFQSGRLLACFEDATVRYFRILNNGRWDLQMQ